jgi:hypothetical protein
MSHLEALKKSAELREQAEKDAMRLKEIFSEIMCLHNTYNGEMLNALEEFLITFKQKQ